jgi:fibronectin-binding autotransporter adhesin
MASLSAIEDPAPHSTSTFFSFTKMNTTHLFNPHSGLTRLIVASSLVISSTGAVKAADGTWKTTGGNWSEAANSWVNSTVADGAGSTANLTNDISANASVTIDTTSRTLGVLNIGDTDATNNFTLSQSGAATLTFNNNSAKAQLNVVSGSGAQGAALSVPLKLDSSLDISNSSSGLLTFNSGATISANSTGTKTVANVGTGSGGTLISGIISNGSGTVALAQSSATSNLTISGANTYTGGTTISAGVLTVSSGSVAALGAGSVNLTGGKLVYNTTTSTNGTRPSEINVAKASLSGNGTIRSAVTVGTGGVIAPTIGNALRLQIAGSNITGTAVTMNDGSAFAFDLAAVTPSHLRFLSFANNDLVLNGSVFLNITNAKAGTYTLMSFFTDTSGTIAATSGVVSSGLTLGSGFDGFDAQINYNPGTISLTLATSTIPEPATYGVILGLAACVFAARRNRSRAI